MRKCLVDNEHYLLSGLDGASERGTHANYGPRFHVIHFVRAKADFLYHVHTHSTFEMIIPLKGAYKCVLNTVEVSLKPGSALLIQPEDIHQDMYLPGMEYCGTIFDLDLPETSSAPRRIFKPDIPTLSQVVKCENLNAIRHVKASLSRPEGIESIFVHYMASASLQAVFWEILSGVPRKLLAPGFLSKPERDAFRKRLIQHFEAHTTDRFSLDKMARAMGLSKSSLSHKCANLLGAPPAKAFLDFRLEKARRHLKDDGMSVKEACLELGFANQFHFSRAFKRRFGVPPSKLA